MSETVEFEVLTDRQFCIACGKAEDLPRSAFCKNHIRAGFDGQGCEYFSAVDAETRKVRERAICHGRLNNAILSLVFPGFGDRDRKISRAALLIKEELEGV